MGLTYSPICAVLPEISPISMHYARSALTFNLAGIFDASFAPLISRPASFPDRLPDDP